VLSVDIGEVITILPIGDVSGVTTTGLRWSLKDTSLERGTTVGISNESVSRRVTIDVGKGAVIVAREGAIL
jgi:thiamine pyrophosphokinase